MGSSHDLPSRRKRRNSDCISNYVDRVRICDSKSIASESVYSKASSQKSGWRQKSYSSIDLTSNGDFPGAGAFRYRDFDSQDDISIKNLKNSKNQEIQRDYEDIYNVNPKAQGYKRDVIKEHNEVNIKKRENDVCSLRRSKSLAVIREETFNDLSIDGPKTRRSQLIPRAKLIDRNFFRSRLSFALEEGLSFSLDSSLANEKIKSSSNSNTIKSSKSVSKTNIASLDNSNSNSNLANNTLLSWNCDKSDLSSIDSNFFKNSLHQSALLDKSSTSDPTKIVSRVEVHNENDSNADNSSDKNILENGSVKTGKEKSENVTNNNNKRNDQNNSDDNENSVNINEDTESGITIIEIKDRKQSSGPTSSVISYDSIYLSSESDKQTVLGEEELANFDDIDLKIKDFEKIIKELNLIGDSDKSDTVIDNLYCQVAKGSSGSLSEVNLDEPKINTATLGKYTDYISKGTLERLAILSGFSSINSNSRKSIDINNKENIKDYGHNNSNLNVKKDHFQYSSLPDVDISKLLRDCELIDAKLRDDVSIELLEPYPDYDIDLESIDPSTVESSISISKYDVKDNVKVIVGTSIENQEKVNASEDNNLINSQTSVNEPVSLEEENPKGAPSIELVQLTTKELGTDTDEKQSKEDFSQEREQNTTKIYIPDLGLELDYENSIASFNSDEDFESPSDEFDPSHHSNKSLNNTPSNFHLPFYNAQALNLITISGKKVIIDELAAKTEQQKDTNNNRKGCGIKESFETKHKQSVKEKPQRKSIERKVYVEEELLVLDSLEKDFSSVYSSKEELQNGKLAEKINGADNSNQRHKINIDKGKINLPECKQASKYNTDSSCADKKVLFRNNTDIDGTYRTPSTVTGEKRNDCVEKVISSDRNNKTKKDFTSFCILQKSNSIDSNHNKMPRPQLLNIVDSKNSIPKLHPEKQQQITNKSDMGANRDGRTILNESDEKPSLDITEKEFLHKVDSVRNYWSRMLDSEVIEMKGNNLKSMSKVFSASKSSSDIPQSLQNEDGFQSFFPTVEIIELNNGETQAALVTARKLNDVEFDHVRYKVMKSEMFQKNIARSNNHRKETQFDGLMQYLQDYSFQELLANNNVVIIEPVRTKIEKVSEKPNKSQSAVCKITNGATQLHRHGSNNLKKHFFYHPIRVNKELYEDELPVPDTVRNVRKMFEDSLRLDNSSQLSERASKMSKSSDNLKARKTIRYLTIDTSFDNNLAASKWDSISLSSGVSSAADLSSPCECHDGNLSRNAYNNSRNGSKENLRRNESVESRDYGPITCNVVKSLSHAENHKVNSESMIKSGTKDGNGLKEKCNCNWRQPRNNFPINEKYQQPQKKKSNDYTGLKFKLVKSNSCSSRLELAGTGVGEINAIEEMRNIVHGQRIQLYDENEEYNNGETIETAENEYETKEDLEHEETVKDMIYKLEAKNFSATKPRIIESRCIEKVPRDAKVTINNQTFEGTSEKSSNLNSPLSPSSLIQNAYSIDSSSENVTVNNHISILNGTTEPIAESQNNTKMTQSSESVEIVKSTNGNKVSSAKPKIVRNKNVDLAMIAVNKKNDVMKNPKGLCNSVDIKSLPLAHNHSNNDIQEIPNNHHNHERKSWDISASMMQSVEIVRHQDKINCSHSVKSHTAAVEEQDKSLVDDQQQQQQLQPTVKMVNWGTVGILNKEYFANDNKLVQLKPYDEMEFEEFEVAGEHYDSLNSK